MRVRFFAARSERWRDELSAYVDGELSDRQRARVEARLAKSEEMRAYLADLEQMRSVFRQLAPSPTPTPFQLTPEMLSRSAHETVAARSTARALRLSMAAAAIGVATFGAAMLFDLLDSPSVRFTATDASATLSAEPTSAQPEQTATEGASAQDADTPTPVMVASVAAQEEVEAEQAAQEQVQSEDAEPTPSAQQRAAADDPARRALTSGTGQGDSGAQAVSAEDVVAQQAEPSDTAASQATTEESAAPAVEAVATPQQSASASVATTPARSDWPLEQRPRSSSVELATDPSWEQPLQFVLAALAAAALAVYLALLLAQRRHWI